ncbi:MAG: hypothetical protein M1827_004959 [Pycnora praestabilis]|nr:MAG: hypothetical protein M1827_004959 [Pycnora praestabilis]
MIVSVIVPEELRSLLLYSLGSIKSPDPAKSEGPGEACLFADWHFKIEEIGRDCNECDRKHEPVVPQAGESSASGSVPKINWRDPPAFSMHLDGRFMHESLLDVQPRDDLPPVTPNEEPEVAITEEPNVKPKQARREPRKKPIRRADGTE